MHYRVLTRWSDILGPYQVTQSSRPDWAEEHEGESAMRSIGGLALITFGTLWVLAGLMGIFAGSLGASGPFGSGAFDLLVGAILIALGAKVRSTPSNAEGDDTKPQ